MTTTILLDAILLAATVVALFLHLPQLAQTYQTKNVTSFHKGTIILRIVANVLYALYSILEEIWILFATSTMIVVFESILLIMVMLWS